MDLRAIKDQRDHWEKLDHKDQLVMRAQKVLKV